MPVTIERLTVSFPLGEGPHWDAATQNLYFVECIEKYLVKYNPETKKITKVSTGSKQASFIIPVEGQKDNFIISLDKELAIIHWDGENDKFSVVKKLCVADDAPETTNNKFNDAKCDSHGRLWAGTLNLDLTDFDKTLPVGSLYSFDCERKLKRHVEQIRVSNGIAINDKAKCLFHIDTLTSSVFRFDFDVIKGTINNRQVWFTLSQNNVQGSPDGMAIDTDGNLWIAAVGGGQVIKVDGSKPQTLIDTIKMPAIFVTSVAFGGPNLDELYATSACFEIKGETPPKPANGALYKIVGTGSRGFPANNFKLQ